MDVDKKADTAPFSTSPVDLEKQVKERIKTEQAQFDKPDTARAGFGFEKISEVETSLPEFLIKDMVESDSFLVIFGDPESLKTFVAIDMACCVATGKPFHGHDVKKTGPTLFIIGEGRSGFKRRILAWCIHNGVDINELPVFVSTRKAALCDPASASEVVSAVECVATKHGPPALVVIDTLARNFGPGDENRTEDMTGFVDACDAIRERYQSTVSVVHHTGHSEKHRARGAIALRAALDAEYRVDRDAENVIRFKATKMKDAERPEPLAFRINIVDLVGMVDEDGVPVTSVVLEQTSYAPPPIKGKKGRGEKQILAIEVLKNLIAERHQDLIDGGRDPNTVRVSVDEWKNACIDLGWMVRTTFNSVKKSLTDQGIVQINHGFVELPQ